MTKSLLTANDVRSFILEQVAKLDVRQPGCFTLTEISRKLKVSKYVLEKRVLKYKLKPHFIKGRCKYYSIKKVVKLLQDIGIEFDYQYSMVL